MRTFYQASPTCGVHRRNVRISCGGRRPWAAAHFLLAAFLADVPAWATTLESQPRDTLTSSSSGLLRSERSDHAELAEQRLASSAMDTTHYEASKQHERNSDHDERHLLVRRRGVDVDSADLDPCCNTPDWQDDMANGCEEYGKDLKMCETNEQARSNCCICKMGRRQDANCGETTTSARP
eukprot:TRINITY_DN73608_c0_g1_i1.p2 TRINITY_DN73608_c0_g1~~TRINITY_DN73608_c0_g1_i1.p2  ORF type:complete len:181 (+),score=21.58 TRINITY_DN73608_c0_g1_i1:100-642(+)